MRKPAHQEERLSWIFPAVLAAGVAWWACSPLITPYRELEKADRETIAGLRGQLNDAHSLIDNARTLESKTEALRSQMDRLDREIPGPSEQGLLPEQVKKHFARFGLSVSLVRMNRVEEEFDLSGYDRGYWSVSLPIANAQAKVAESLLAAAEFEQQHPFVKMRDFVIQPDPDNPQGRIALLNLEALIRK